MHSNVPIIQTRHILEDIIEQNLINPQIKRELLTWYDIIIKQNYFISSNNNNNNNNITILNDRLVMGAPSSSILSEVYLQHLENSYIAYLTQKHRIIIYFVNVDDILLIFDPNHTYKPL
jgi:hypothetical protein